MWLYAGHYGLRIWLLASAVAFGGILLLDSCGGILCEGVSSFFFLEKKEPKIQDCASLLAKATGTLAGRIPSGRCWGREPFANGAVLPPGIAPARKAVPQSALVLLAQPREVGPFY